MKKFEYITNNRQSFGDAKNEFLDSLTDDERQMEYDFERLTKDYKYRHQAFFNGQLSPKKMREYVTQPYFHSMILCRKRHEQKNISVDIEMETYGMSDALPFSFDNNNRFYAGTRQDILNIQRTFIMNGRKIGRFESVETGRICFLKSNVNYKSGTAVCPNCGYNGSLSSFIDGCDACGSAFTVNDFESKVSGFALQEDWVEKYVYSIGIGFLFLLLTLLIIVIITSVLKGMLQGTIMFAGFILPLFFSYIPVTTKTYKKISKDLTNGWINIENENYVKNAWNWFFTDVFFQNLDYKIKNIHMASSEREVSSFATCSLNKAVQRYSNVIDCDITHIVFKKCKTVPSGYQLDFSVTVRLFEINKKKIRKRYEEIECSEFIKKDVINNSVYPLREYKCNNCGSSVNILEGSECKYCGTVYEYSNYDWVFTKYESAGIKSYKYVRLMVIYYLLFFAIFLGLWLLFSWPVFRFFDKL